MAVDDTGWPREPAPPATDAVEEARIRGVVAARLRFDEAQPARLGRFVLLGRVGAGGMGVVYAAYDDRLDRKVAIKLLHTGIGDELHERLVREAQAMARLSHPNVVAVFEIGEHLGRALVVMEFVTGSTMRAWLRAADRPWPEVVAKYIDAGRGLAAAHAAGVVHRDFKPDNVLVGDDGRVRVADFGLAHGIAGSDERAPDSAEQTLSSGDPLATPLTREGALLGTPGYMPPEQIRGEPTDARTDQFAFCVSLWEALVGRRPFERDGSPSSPAPRGRMPAWIDAILRRGLAPDAHARYGSMNDLLAALGNDPARARRVRRVLALGLLAIPALAGLYALRTKINRDGCVREAAGIDAVWHAEARARVTDGLLASGAGNATTTLERLLPRIDAYSDRWRAHAERACMATHEDASWSAELRDRSSACLEDGRIALDTLVTVLASADVAAVQEAVPSAGALPRPEACSDAQELAARDRPDDGPERERVREVERELAAVAALQLAGKLDEALARSETALVETEGLSWLPIRASVRLRIASLSDKHSDYPRAEREYEAAFHDAAAARHDELATQAAIAAMWTVSSRLERPADGDRWERLVQTFFARLTDPPLELVAEHEARRAEVAATRGDYEGAAAGATRAVELFERALGPESGEVADALNGLAEAQLRLGRVDDARASWTRSGAILGALYGADHPTRSHALTGLAWVEQSTGNPLRALEIHREALALREHAYGGDHDMVANALINVADCLSQIGRVDEAERELRRAIAIFEHRLGPEHPSLAGALGNLANLELTAGHNREAKQLAERALAIMQRVRGPDHPESGRLINVLGGAEESLGDLAAARAHFEQALAIAEVHPHTPIDPAHELNNLANVESALGEYESAGAHYRRALDIIETRLGPQHPSLAFPLTGIGTTSNGLGDVPAARAAFTRALEIRRATLPPDHPMLGFSLVNLARVESEAGEHEQARAHLDEAMGVFADHPGLVYALATVGANELAAGRVDASLEALERALPIATAAVGDGTGSPSDLADVQWKLAQSLARARGGSSRARTLARAAAATLRADTTRRSPDLAAIEAWLDDRTLRPSPAPR